MRPRSVRSMTRLVLIELTVAIIIVIGVPIGCLMMEEFTINKPSLPVK